MSKKNLIIVSLCVLVMTAIILPNQNTIRLMPPFYKTVDTVQAVQSLEDFGRVHYTENEHPIHLVHSGRKDAPAVLFIHGSPGSWEAWAEYLHDPELRESAFMIAVDRPGYGGSNDGTSGLSLEEQARLIMEALMHSFPKRDSFIIAGHSYGGPIALRLAIDYPSSVESMLLLAPAIAPELVRVKWYNKLADLFFVRPFLPVPLHHSNEEMIPLKGELIKMEPRLTEVKTSTTVIQGQKDWIVLPGNAEFAKISLSNAAVHLDLLQERGHFIPWEEYTRVKETLMKHLRGRT